MSLFTAALETFAKDFLESNAEIAQFKDQFKAMQDAIVTLEAKVEELEKALKPS